MSNSGCQHEKDFKVIFALKLSENAEINNFFFLYVFLYILVTKSAICQY